MCRFQLKLGVVLTPKICTTKAVQMYDVKRKDSMHKLTDSLHQITLIHHFMINTNNKQINHHANSYSPSISLRTSILSEIYRILLQTTLPMAGSRRRWSHKLCRTKYSWGLTSKAAMW
mmetsp:Transcript_26041/g.39865  ORF Transcript_26041/g.39865 Transcript_26041/m.39865 type:complete len:118 (-) Transcript_26041:68-421(-)